MAGSRLEAELARALSSATRAWGASSSLAALRPVTVYDPVNVSVWLKAIAKSPVSLTCISIFLEKLQCNHSLAFILTSVLCTV